MRHLVLTRSAYGPGYPLAANRRRLALTRATSIPSMAAQSGDWTWCVLLHPDDPLRAERLAAFSSAGPTRFLDGRLDPSGQQDGSALGAWRIEHDGPTLTTRLDDDDAIAPWFLGAMARAAGGRRRLVLTVPRGWWYAGGHVRALRYPSNMFVSLYDPSGSGSVMDVAHTAVSSLGPMKPADPRPGWLWVRHADARCGLLPATKRPGAARAAFPLDWPALDAMAYR